MWATCTYEDYNSGKKTLYRQLIYWATRSTNSTLIYRPILQRILKNYISQFAQRIPRSVSIVTVNAVSLNGVEKVFVCVNGQRDRMDGGVERLHTVAFKPNIEGSRNGFTAQPIRVPFSQLLQTSNALELVPRVQNQEVLSAVVALFDVSLPDIGPQDIHDTIYCPGVYTILLLRQHRDVLEEYRTDTSPRPCKPRPVPSAPLARSLANESGGRFSQVFSDSDESSEENSELAEGSVSKHRLALERFHCGVQEFLAKAGERRARREGARPERDVPPAAVGVESLIVAAATYQLKRLTTGEKVMQLSLLATRRRYRNCGVGRYMVELLKNQAVCGVYQVFLAHADSDAVGFFTRCGLTDDILLNDKFKEVREEWTNTTLMSYLPPFTTESESRNPGFSLSLSEMEMEVDMAKSKALLAYQQQAVCVKRLVQEVKTLREQMKLQREEVEGLTNELEKERERRRGVEQQFLEYRLRKTWLLLEHKGIDSDDQDYSDPPSDPSSPCGVNECSVEEGQEKREAPT